MSRGFAAANATAAASSHVRPVDFIQLELDSGTIRVHNGLGTIADWGGGADWLGMGNLISMGVIEEGNDATPRKFWVRLNAFNDDIKNDALTEEVYKRVVTVYIGFIGDDGQLVNDPHDSMWKGFGDNRLIVLGHQNYILMECELEVALDHVANGSLFTDEDQQKRYSGDTGFQFVDQMIGAKVSAFGHEPDFGAVVEPRERRRRNEPVDQR